MSHGVRVCLSVSCCCCYDIIELIYTEAARKTVSVPKIYVTTVFYEVSHYDTVKSYVGNFHFSQLRCCNPAETADKGRVTDRMYWKIRIDSSGLVIPELYIERVKCQS